MNEDISHTRVMPITEDQRRARALSTHLRDAPLDVLDRMLRLEDLLDQKGISEPARDAYNKEYRRLLDLYSPPTPL